jgi:serine/threonine protein kinase
MSFFKMSTKQWTETFRPRVFQWVKDFAREYYTQKSTTWVEVVMAMLDKYFDTTDIRRELVQCVACACMYICSILVLGTCISIADFRAATDDSCSINEINAQIRKYLHAYVRPAFNPFFGYTLLKMIGQGNSSVHEAVFVDNEASYAVKVFELDDNQIPYNFLQEVRTLSNMKHSNCCGFHGAWMSVTQCFVIYTLYPTNFQQYFNKSRSCDIASVRKALFELLTAVAYAHSLSYAHRDVKPSNIMFNSSGVLKLCDWDSSVYAETTTVSRTNPICTLPWRSPELFLEPCYSAHALDAWSVGAVFAAMILRVPPFPGILDEEVLSQILEQRGSCRETFPAISVTPRPWPHKITQVLGLDGIELLEMLLELDPEQRISCSDALNHPFFAT